MSLLHVLRRQARLAAALGLLIAGGAVQAHVGSPNVFFEGMAGPYPVRVVIRPPAVVPGLAEIAVRTNAAVEQVAIRLFRWDVGEDGAPPPEAATRVPGDAELHSTELWLMTAGAHSVEIAVSGPAGAGVVIVPFESRRREALEMAEWYAAGLLAMGLFLYLGAVTILSASVREGTLPPGTDVDAARKRRGRVVAIAGALGIALAAWGGWNWWDAVDATYRASIFEAMPTAVSVQRVGEQRILNLAITEQRWIDGEWTPLVPDHGKLMHMFLVKDDLEAFAHVHPVPADRSNFRLALPPLPAGTYRLYADIVHESGFGQTLVNEFALTGDAPRVPALAPPLAVDPDDSWTTGRHAAATVEFEDGTRIVWDGPTAAVEAGQDLTLAYRVYGPDGEPAELEPYMGMLSHSAITLPDGAVFVHLHPAGSISMGALRIATERMQTSAGHGIADGRGQVAFPYAFPRAGEYQIWVQVKRAGTVYTADFQLAIQ